MKKIANICKKICHYDYRKYCNQNALFLSFVLISAINGMLLRFFTVANYFEIKPFLGDITFIIIVGSFGYVFKPRNQFKYYLIISIIFTIICIINSLYYTNYLSYVSFSLLATSLQIFGVGDAITQNIMELKDFCYLWQIFAILFVHFTLKKRQYYQTIASKNFGKKRVKQTLLGGIIFLFLFICTLTPTDIGRITKQWNREYIVMKFGIYTYQFSDFIYNSTFKLTNFFSYDNSLKIFREYYDKNLNENIDNEYTDIFKGKNVLVIHAESIQQFTMNLSFNGLELTPNLNKLANEGIYFSNFYSQESVGTSSDTEFTFNTSLMPAVSGTVFMVFTLLVISSPTTPSPRVAALTNLPFSYCKDTLKPSIFNSHTYFGFIPSFFILSSKLIISLSLNTFDKDNIGILCVTFSNPSKTFPPARCVGESALFISG